MKAFQVFDRPDRDFNRGNLFFLPAAGDKKHTEQEKNGYPPSATHGEPPVKERKIVSQSVLL
jgi:hypothetical protein